MLYRRTRNTPGRYALSADAAYRVRRLIVSGGFDNEHFCSAKKLITSYRPIYAFICSNRRLLY
ncbi:hypothetical protein [Perigonia lusca single nucleopolyhedrovirus]|uniref:Uncharacterized protein n=1 Tax=Perigonia lusca single nucleopolyhedrovirus TaxID=1675865 RepID=A0A0M3N026_9ABAC|nr:hypothetical protein [Perigonia lusca single nucleopolyhedrovirus]AKN80549.1 hypothetical protein [Perigonia lusca single nucleopolyhedrovirus]